MDNEDLLAAAIDGCRLVAFAYHGLRRVAEPHDLGVLNGAKQLLAYQLGGESRSGALPDWRRFDVDQISDLRVLSQTFRGPRPVPSGKHSAFDVVLASVYR